MNSIIPLSLPKGYEQILEDAEKRKRLDKIFAKFKNFVDESLLESLTGIIKKFFRQVSHKEAESEADILLWIAIVRLFMSYDDFEQKSHKEQNALIYTAAERLCLTQLIKEKLKNSREKLVDFSKHDLGHIQHETILSIDKEAFLQKLITFTNKDLTEKEYKIFHCKAILDWSHKMIAEHLDISYTNSTSIFSNVHKKILDKFGKEYADLFI